MDEERLRRIRSGRLLEVIRVRTAMYVGERELSAVSHFLGGWDMALRVYDIQAERQLPDDFHDWVAYRLHFYESTMGYRDMILSRVPDESAALDRFFELLDEHQRRKSRLVARVLADKEDRIRQLRPHGAQEGEGMKPQNLNLVSYTDDPGFFVMLDGEESKPPVASRFFPTVRSLELRLGVKMEDITILASDIFTRWLSQENRFNRV